MADPDIYSSDRPKMSEIPVLISGAGPTGLFTALHLQKMNIPFRLIERDLTFSRLSKAFGIHSRTQEILQMTDPALIQEFLETGYLPHLFRIYFGGSLACTLEIPTAKESHFSRELSLPQAKTVDILAKALEKTGAKIEWGWELVDTKVVESSENNSPSGSSSSSPSSWVETTIRRALDGTNKRKGESKVLGTVEIDAEDEEKKYEYETIRSQFLIGADGGRSAVRHKINMPFPGKTRDVNLILFEGTAESTTSDLSEVTFLSGNSNRTAGWFPLGEKNKILIVLETGILTQEQFEAQKSETLKIESFQQTLDETLHPHKLNLKTLNLLTNYRINERRAKEFAYKGRIFLAGDSAHVHSPAGGQGLNLGLQDAYNLAWKIGLVVNGTAPISLLDSYNEERPLIADEVIELTSKTLDKELGSYSNTFQRIIKRVIITLLPYVMPFLKDDSPPASMLRLRYHENSLNKSHKTQEAPSGTGAVGQRARDANLIPLTNKASEDLSTVDDSNPSTTTEPATTIRLHELMGHPGAFQILVFTADLWESNLESVTELAKTMDRRLSGWRTKWPSAIGNGKKDATTQHHQFVAHTFTTHLTPNPGNPLVDRILGDGKAFADQEGILHERYSVSTKAKTLVESGGALVVVRPDSYIAYRVLGTGESAWNDVDEYLGSILVNRQTPIEG